MEKNGKNEEQLEEKLNYVFTAEKAGMEGLDKDKIAEIIYETTKNSRIFKKNEEDLKILKDEIDKINKELESFHKQEILYQQVKNKADSRLNFLKNQIRFDKIWMHLDMDMFYAAVEIRDDPSLANIPMCVGNKSMISTSNYIARKYGVRSAMPGFIAEKLCPNLKFVPGNFEKYHIESEKIMNVIMEYDENYESMGLDEAYVDLTNYCFENNIKTEEDIIKLGKEIKKKIFDSTKLTSSIGIAANKTLAKICSDYNKPELLVDCVAGACFFTTIDVIKSIDYLDEEVFLFYEEDILGYRLDYKQYQTYLLNNVEFVHMESQSIKKTYNYYKKMEYLFKSRMYYQKTYNDINQFQTLLFYALWGIRHVELLIEVPIR